MPQGSTDLDYQERLRHRAETAEARNAQLEEALRIAEAFIPPHMVEQYGLALMDVVER